MFYKKISIPKVRRKFRLLPSDQQQACQRTLRSSPIFFPNAGFMRRRGVRLSNKPKISIPDLPPARCAAFIFVGGGFIFLGQVIPPFHTH